MQFLSAYINLNELNTLLQIMMVLQGALSLLVSVKSLQLMIKSTKLQKMESLDENRDIELEKRIEKLEKKHKTKSNKKKFKLKLSISLQ